MINVPPFNWGGRIPGLKRERNRERGKEGATTTPSHSGPEAIEIAQIALLDFVEMS